MKLKGRSGSMPRPSATAAYRKDPREGSTTCREESFEKVSEMRPAGTVALGRIQSANCWVVFTLLTLASLLVVPPQSQVYSGHLYRSPVMVLVGQLVVNPIMCTQTSNREKPIQQPLPNAAGCAGAMIGRLRVDATMDEMWG